MLLSIPSYHLYKLTYATPLRKKHSFVPSPCGCMQEDGKIREFFVDDQGNCKYKFANFTIYTPYFLQQGSYIGQVNIEDHSQGKTILTDQWEMDAMDVYFDTKASSTGYHYPLRLTTKHRMMVTPAKVEKKSVNEDLYKVLDFVNLSAGPVDDSVFDVPVDCKLLPPKP